MYAILHIPSAQAQYILINGNQIQNNDEIGIYNPAGLCCGSAVWNGDSLNIVVHQKDANQNNKGFAAGEVYTVMLWDQSADMEYNTDASYNIVSPYGDSTYSVGVTSVVTSLISKFTALNSTVGRTINSNTGSISIGLPDGTVIKLSFTAGDVSGQVIDFKGFGITLPTDILSQDANYNDIADKAASFFSFESGLTAGSFSATLEITFSDIALNALGFPIADIPKLVFAYFDTASSAWTKIPSTLTIGAGSNTLTATIDHFSTWAMADSTDPDIVPVELASCRAVIGTDNNVTLNWTTYSEINNYGFYIERSPDNINYEEIGFIKGSGTSTVENTYSYIDTDSKNAGDYYYRLKQIDFDGTYEYSEIMKLAVAAPKNYRLEQNYPNPFNPVTTIKFQIPEASEIALTVYDLSGKEIKTLLNEQKSAGYYNIEWNGTNNSGMQVSSGVYIYKLRTNTGFVKSQKMIFLK